MSVTRTWRGGLDGHPGGKSQAGAAAGVAQDGLMLEGVSAAFGERVRTRTQVCSGMSCVVWFGDLFSTAGSPLSPFLPPDVGHSTNTLGAHCEQALPGASKMGIVPFRELLTQCETSMD